VLTAFCLLGKTATDTYPGAPGAVAGHAGILTTYSTLVVVVVIVAAAAAASSGSSSSVDGLSPLGGDSTANM